MESPAPEILLVGSAKPDPKLLTDSHTQSEIHLVEAPKEKPPVLQKVKDKVQSLATSWWEKAGPKEVEQHFVDIHKRVMESIPDEKRKEEFEKMEDSWRKFGHGVGVASSVIDFGLVGLFSAGAILLPSIKNYTYLESVMEMMRTPILDDLQHIARNIPQRIASKLYPTGETFIDADHDLSLTFEKNAVATESGLIGLTMLLSPVKPAHMIAHLFAGATEAGARASETLREYSRSGKAAEHAKAVGSAVGSVAKASAEFARENPELVKQTVNVVADASIARQNRALEAERAQKRAAEMAKRAELNEIRSTLFHRDQDYYRARHGADVTASIISDADVMTEYNNRHNPTKVVTKSHTTLF